jgi:hypothetical protein
MPEMSSHMTYFRSVTYSSNHTLAAHGFHWMAFDKGIVICQHSVFGRKRQPTLHFCGYIYSAEEADL